MKTNLLSIGILLGCAFFLIGGFYGCTSTPEREPATYDTMLIEASDLKIELTFVDEATLIYRHGRNNAQDYENPYYGFPAIITRKNFYVFEFSASTVESEIHFRLRDIDFRKGSVRGDAKSREYLARIWSHYNKDQSTSMEKTLDETILPREFTVSPDSPVSGYLVFAENYSEEEREALMSFYLTTVNGDSGKLDLPIYFYEDNVSDTVPENTGIFSKD